MKTIGGVIRKQSQNPKNCWKSIITLIKIWCTVTSKQYALYHLMVHQVSSWSNESCRRSYPEMKCGQMDKHWRVYHNTLPLSCGPASVAQLDARPTGDQEVAGSTPAEVGNILSWRLIMKYFLRSFSPFRWFKKGSCQFLAKECAQYWLTA